MAEFCGEWELVNSDDNFDNYMKVVGESILVLNVSSITRKSTSTIYSGCHSMEPVSLLTAYLSTWRPPCGHISCAPLAASSRIDRGYHNLTKAISFWPFLRLPFPRTYQVVNCSHKQPTWSTLVGGRCGLVVKAESTPRA